MELPLSALPSPGDKWNHRDFSKGYRALVGGFPALIVCLFKDGPCDNPLHALELPNALGVFEDLHQGQLLSTLDDLGLNVNHRASRDMHPIRTHSGLRLFLFGLGATVRLGVINQDPINRPIDPSEETLSRERVQVIPPTVDVLGYLLD